MMMFEAGQELQQFEIFLLETEGWRWWCAYGGVYQFNIVYDAEYKVFSASWKNSMMSKKPFKHMANYIGSEIHPEAKLPFSNHSMLLLQLAN